ncbi:MAG: YigZ family protein [Bacteroidetes bacterium]|nr:YigZ family protein [Bacteroidota bacterium]
METATDVYLSVVGESQGVYREKASKFIAFAMPVSTEEEVKEKLDSIRKAYHDANHHCYAYRLGHENPIYRTNDDGEPSGSAGKPIYGQILSTRLSDILIVVIRYFGGTKLGIPGLIHAYRTASREALDTAQIVEKTIRINFRVVFSYESMNEIMRIVKEEQVKMVRQITGEHCTIEFLVRKSVRQKVENRLARLKIVSIEIFDISN